MSEAQVEALRARANVLEAQERALHGIITILTLGLWALVRLATRQHGT